MVSLQLRDQRLQDGQLGPDRRSLGNQCVWRGCARNALIERFVCAEHLLGKCPTSPGEPALLTGLREYLRTRR
jgi:hypothetical protein